MYLDDEKFWELRNLLESIDTKLEGIEGIDAKLKQLLGQQRKRTDRAVDRQVTPPNIVSSDRESGTEHLMELYRQYKHKHRPVE